MKIEIRSGIPESASLWDVFLSAGWNGEYNLTETEYYTTALESRFIVSAYSGEKLIGYGRIAADGIMHAMIYDLIVLPEYRGYGAGSEILEKLIKLCREAGIKDIQLFCARGKREFYEKRGFAARPADAPGMDYEI